MPSPPVLDRLRKSARANSRRIVLPEVDDERIRQARDLLIRDGLVDVVWVERPATDARLEEVVSHIHERRRSSGVDADEAREMALNPLYFAASLVALGHADAGVAGAVNPTAEVIRAAIHCIGQADDCDGVSSMFLMVRDREVLSYTDCSVVPEPSPEQLAAAAVATAKYHHAFTDEEPRVAFLSFSTHGSARHDRVDKVRAAVDLFRRLEPEIAADGDLQFDSAYVADVARRKVPKSTVAGQANVFVFPDLDAGNIAYKITERLGGFSAFGPLMQGLRHPFLDLSRGCSTDDVINVAVIAAVMAGASRRRPLLP